MNSRSILLFAIGFVLLAAALFGGDSNDPKLSGIDVKFEDVDVKLLLSTKIAALYTNQLQESENPNCRAAAVLVSQEAVDKYSYWAKFVDLWKKVTDKVKDGADLVGAKTVSKIAQLSGTIVECFDDQEPAAAFGRAMIEEGADWIKDQLTDQIPKTGSKLTDAEIKKKAEAAADAARDKLVQALFPGKKEKARDFQTSIGDCDVRVVPEFEWPGPNGKGGLRVYIDGDCKCKKPLKLAAHGAGTAQVVNSGLGQFKLIVFLPLERIDSDVSYGGKAINLKKYLETGSKLKKEIENALKGEKNKQSPVDLAKELQDQTGKLTDGIKATLTLRPVFEKQIRIEQLKIMSCDDCNKPKGPSQGGVTEQPPSPAATNADKVNCDQRCGGLREAWDKLQTPFLQEKARDEKKTWDPEKKREMSPADQRQAEITSKKNRLDTVRDRRTTAQKNLDAQKPQLQKDIAAGEQRMQGVSDEVRNEMEKMVQKLRDRLQALEQPVAAEKYNVERAEEDLAKAEKIDREAREKLHDLEQKSDAARAAYYDCAKCCWDQAKAAKPDTKIPKDIEDWGNEHPSNCCLNGTWRSESVVRTAKSGGAGILMTIKDGSEVTIDYTGMQELKQVTAGRVLATDSWTGSASGHITSSGGVFTVTSVEKSDVTHTGGTVEYGSKTQSTKGLGPVFEGGGKAYQLNYTCSNDSLIIKVTLQGQAIDTYTFKRAEMK